MKNIVLFLSVLGFNCVVHAYAPPTGLEDSANSKMEGLRSGVLGITLDHQTTNSAVFEQMTSLMDRAYCHIQDPEERAQHCPAAMEEAKEKARNRAQEDAQAQAEKQAVQDMKPKRIQCERLADVYMQACVNTELPGLEKAEIGSCEDIIPHVVKAKGLNSDLRAECKSALDAMKDPCTEPVVAEIPAGRVSAEAVVSGLAEAKASNPNAAVFNLPAEEGMVSKYQNMLANYESLDVNVNTQIAELSNLEVKANECKTGQISTTASNLASRKVEYTDEEKQLGLETSRDDVNLIYASAKAAEADAAGLWQEEKRRAATGQTPTVMSDVPTYQVYQSALNEHSGTTQYYTERRETRRATVSQSGDDFASILGGGGRNDNSGGASGGTINNVPMPRLRPEQANNRRSEVDTKSTGTSTTTTSNTNARNPQTNNNTQSANTNSPTQDYLNNTNAYGGGVSSGGAGGFNPASLLSAMGSKANEKVGQFNGVDYTGNSFYANANGRYRSNDGSYNNLSSKTKGGNLRAGSGGLSGSMQDGLNQSGGVPQVNWGTGAQAGGHGSSSGGRGFFIGQTGGQQGQQAAPAKEKQDRGAKAKTGGNKQLYSNKNSNSGGASANSSGGRIFASSNSNSRSPASIKEEFKKAQKLGYKFDPSRYEPTDFANRKAYERVTGRHVAGHRGDGVRWPKDIRQCKRPDSCKDVFSHMSDQFRVQFLPSGI